MADKCSCNKKTGYPAKVRATVNGFERIITFMAGYKCEIPFNKGNSHGRHSVNMLWILKGEKAALQFLVFTGWDYEWKQMEGHKGIMAADVGYHAYEPQYEGQSVQMQKCEWLNGKPCFYDGSSLNAERYMELLVNTGEEAVWEEMEKEYKERFDSK